ncbi:winged helix-turn helix domain-containing protein [Ditylenchus destructor]|nr:winged helix-turn helix domain-containing protein [Ditylenchus destructor]
MSSKRAAVIELYKQGQGVNNIARLLKIHHSNISRTVSRFKELGTLEDRPRSGRPPDQKKDKKKQLRWGVAYSPYERGTRNSKVATQMKGVVFRFIVKPVDPQRRIEAQLQLN